MIKKIHAVRALQIGARCDRTKSALVAWRQAPTGNAAPRRKAPLRRQTPWPAGMTRLAFVKQREGRDAMIHLLARVVGEPPWSADRRFDPLRGERRATQADAGGVKDGIADGGGNWADGAFTGTRWRQLGTIQ
jgi:hypothetical protein